MWGGRFGAKPSSVMQAINASIAVDQRLWRQDIDGSKAHAAMLAAQGIITQEDNSKIQAGLDQIAAEIADGAIAFDAALEDIHLNIEQRLTERIGEPGKRLHTARSRNDQVATDFKLWVIAALAGAEAQITALQIVLLRQADDHDDWVMPGFTHLQTAQPITLGHHLMAYVEMLARDADRCRDARSRAADGCPLGAAALAGTGYPIDRAMTASALGFAAPAANSLDAVSARDFAFAALSALSIAITHVSRLAEEIVLWTSAQFGFARLSDEWSTGSSIMPQKRNPDAAELIRAKTTRITANFSALLGLMKALPLAYAKDLQDDKVLTFEAFDAFELSLAAMIGMMDTITFNRDAMRAAAARGFSTATDLADWLVRDLGVPFRQAHHITGAIVKRAEALGLNDLAAMPLDEMQKIEPRITADVQRLLSVEGSVDSRMSYGGAAPAQVRAQIKRWKEILA
jgi:argininosuccinate lyase